MKNNFAYELKNGKGYVKEYCDNSTMIFVGEYLNGLKNGKGKQYYSNGELMYEGEFKNGFRNGKGKEYYIGNLFFEGEYLYSYYIKGKFYVNKKLEYEGEFLYYKKWNGIGYDEKGNKIYELKNGNGKVIEYHADGDLGFEGEYLNGKRSGKGKEYYPNNQLVHYEGEFLNGLKNGIGKEYNDNNEVIFEGEYLNGERKK